jgi:hypothetical protein
MAPGPDWIASLQQLRDLRVALSTKANDLRVALREAFTVPVDTVVRQQHTPGGFTHNIPSTATEETLQQTLSNRLLIGFDTEWADVAGQSGSSSSGDSTHKSSVVATIQLAVGGVGGVTVSEGGVVIGAQSWVIDAMVTDEDYQADLRSLLEWLWEGTNLVLPVGFSVAQDLIKCRKLSARRRGALCKEEEGTLHLPVAQCVDLQKLVGLLFPAMPGYKPGLQKICSAMFNTFPGGAVSGPSSNHFLSKVEQCSEWGCRPLRESQLTYAGLDAAIMLALISRIRQLI